MPGPIAIIGRGLPASQPANIQDAHNVVHLGERTAASRKADEYPSTEDPFARSSGRSTTHLRAFQFRQRPRFSATILHPLSLTLLVR
jgi:hypothetical protein